MGSNPATLFGKFVLGAENPRIELVCNMLLYSSSTLAMFASHPRSWSSELPGKVVDFAEQGTGALTRRTLRGQDRLNQTFQGESCELRKTSEDQRLLGVRLKIELHFHNFHHKLHWMCRTKNPKHSNDL